MIFQIFRRQTHGDPKFGDYYVLFPSMGFHNYSPEYFGRMRFFSAVNQVYNGDFEKVSDNGQADGWSGSDFLCTETPLEGANCVKLARQPKAHYHSIGSRSFPVTEDCDYVLSLQHRGDAGYVYVQFFDADGKNVPEPNVPFYWLGGSSDWKPHTFCGRVPARAISAYIILRNFSPKAFGGAYFDKVELVAGQE